MLSVCLTPSSGVYVSRGGLTPIVVFRVIAIEFDKQSAIFDILDTSHTRYTGVESVLGLQLHTYCETVQSGARRRRLGRGAATIGRDLLLGGVVRVIMGVVSFIRTYLCEDVGWCWIYLLTSQVYTPFKWITVTYMYVYKIHKSSFINYMINERSSSYTVYCLFPLTK